MTRIRTPLVAVCFAAAMTAAAVAQQTTMPSIPAPMPATNPPKSIVPLKVEVVISRYQGDKKISSLPYTLTFNLNGPNQRTSLRDGVNTRYVVLANGNTNTQYQNVGTSIDCGPGELLPDGRYGLSLNVNDSSIYNPDAGARTDQMAFREYSVSNYVVLKDGQPMLFNTATDKVTGETIKVEVTATAIK